MEINNEEEWVKDALDFITYWEQEVDSLKEKRLDSQECIDIVDVFEKNKNLLLCRKPMGLSDEALVSKLRPLESKLDVSLAKALCSPQ